MRKFRFLSALIAAILLLLLLTACQTAPTDDQILASVPSSGNLTPPSSSVPATSTPATTVYVYSPTGETSLTPNSTMGDPHIHIDYIGVSFAKYDCTNCVDRYLYWEDGNTHELTLLLAEQVESAQENGPYIFYRKTAEPTKIYRMLIGDPSQSELVYESTDGEITGMCFYPGVKNYLQFVQDHKRLIVMDLNTGETTVMLELPYIAHGDVGAAAEGVLSDWVWFEGQISEESEYIQYYFYNRITGEFVEDNDCSD